MRPRGGAIRCPASDGSWVSTAWRSTRRSSKSTSISTPARWAGMNTDRMGRCPAGGKSPEPKWVRGFSVRNGTKVPELLRGVPHENGGDLCPGGGCLGGEGGLGGAGDQALANGPLHGVGGIGGHLVRVGEAGQIAGDLNGIGILKVGEPIEEGGQLLPGQGIGGGEGGLGGAGGDVVLGSPDHCVGVPSVPPAHR